MVKNVITYSDPTRGLGSDLPPFIVDASYMINMAIMKNHGGQGATLIMKNHFGTIHGLNHGAISPRQMGVSNPLVDLLAHKDVGEKTVLFMIDTLYAADGPDATPRKWKLAPFGTPDQSRLAREPVRVGRTAWPSSPLALTFVNAEWGCRSLHRQHPARSRAGQQPALRQKIRPGEPWGA